MTATTVERTAVYRLLDASDAVLYIGASCNLKTRLAYHRSTKPWHLVARIHVDWYETRDEAMAIEKAAITAELPPWNKVHTPRQREIALECIEKYYASITPERRKQYERDLFEWMDRNRAQQIGEGN